MLKSVVSQTQLKCAFICIFILLIQNANCANDFCRDEDVHALILARGGSKGIPMKNMLNINGVSLLGRAIQTIQQSKCFQHLWISTDHEAIAEEALKYGALVHIRGKQYAQDNTTSIESVKEFLMHESKIQKFALFQCTSIFLSERYIVEAMEQFKTHECVFAVARSYKLRWQRQHDGQVVPTNFDPQHRPRRQDWEGDFTETGMFYLSNRDLVLQHERFQSNGCGIVEVAAADALEIDGRYDVTLAKCLMDNNERY